jgi:hypothetical protein
MPKVSIKNVETWNGDTTILTWIGNGASASVHGLNDRWVVKVPTETAQYKVELEIYRILHEGRYPYFLEFMESRFDQRIILQKATQTLRQLFLHLDSAAPTKDQIQKWSLQAARGIAALHSEIFFWVDVGCQNMIFIDGILKLFDFGGSFLEGREVQLSYETWSKYPGEQQATTTADIYKLGAAFYEMVARPKVGVYGEGQEAFDSAWKGYLDALGRSFRREVLGTGLLDILYASYPVELQPIWKVIEGSCSKQQYATADKVVEALESAWRSA